jgi:rhodanese-related sulfurtransferase
VLQAAFKAVRSGQVKEVLHLEGGMYGWFRAELPFVGEYSTENLGRTPNAVGVK